MHARSTLTVFAVFLAAGCSSSTAPDASVAGRYAIRGPQLSPNGTTTITADTLVLGDDGSAVHLQYLEGPGIAPTNGDIGHYTVEHNTVVFTWVCYSNVCGFDQQTDADVVSVLGRVWQLVHHDQGLTETFYRVL